MKLFKKEEKTICPICNIEKLPDDPAKVVIAHNEYSLCSKCEKLMEVIHDRIRSKIDNESI